jgi:hypothetical protein
MISLKVSNQAEEKKFACIGQHSCFQESAIMFPLNESSIAAAPFEHSPNVYALLAGSACDLDANSNGTFQDYIDTIYGLGDCDPLSLDLVSLYDLFQSTTNEAVRGFLLAVMEFKGSIACFGSGSKLSDGDVSAFQFASEELIKAFSVPFMQMLDWVTPMSADAQQLVELTKAADDEMSRGYCVAMLSLRSQFCLISGQIDKGLEIDAVLSKVPNLFAENRVLYRHSLAS